MHWSRNSAVECFVHIEEVTGSNPVDSTITRKKCEWQSTPNGAKKIEK